MIRFISAGLMISSPTEPASAVVGTLRVTPDELIERGTPRFGVPDHPHEESYWALFSSKHVPEIQAEYGRDPWGRVLWILNRLPAGGELQSLRDRGYVVQLYASIVTDTPENSFEIPLEVSRALVERGVGLELSSMTSFDNHVSFSPEW